MRKIAAIALTFLLGASLLAGCRGGSSTDMTTIPSESSGQTGNTDPVASGARGRIGASRDLHIADRGPECHIVRQYN